MRRLFSVALSLKSPSPAVNRHPALWSPDFPHWHFHAPAIVWLTHSVTESLAKKTENVKHFCVFIGIDEADGLCYNEKNIKKVSVWHRYAERSCPC